MSDHSSESDEGKPSETTNFTRTAENQAEETKGLRNLRRTKSVTLAEHITQAEKRARQSQPDRPIHVPRDSLFSWSSGFEHYEGFVNWGILILLIGGLRLFLENVIKYGVKINPLSWLLWLKDQQENDYYYHTPLFLALAHVHVFISFYIEKQLAKDRIRPPLQYYLLVGHLIIIILIPMIVLGIWPHQFSLLGRTVVCVVYTVLFLKLWSYAHVNHWCRLARSSSLSRRRSFTFSKAKQNGQEVNHEEESRTSPGVSLVQYPDNLTLPDLYYFLAAPTLCYELNFPRSQRIRKRFLLRRMLEVVVISNIILAMFQQWMIPSVKNSFQAFSDLDFIRCTERLLKLAIPNHIVWLSWFYLLFHSFLNTMAELLYFADRDFYQDWWNASDVGTFWRLWNLPVHKWALRHVFIPISKHRYSRSVASMAVFLISAALHEYVVSVPLHMYKVGVFLGMMVQVPLVYISSFAHKTFGKRVGNMMVWTSLILGQPLGIMVYYHDYVVKNFDPNMLGL
ncbi:diacylglycerol O-acyltransferase 1-like [Eriocheir sinensis]|uniref:diacylglycerol O-acyltransferase 1-like n=1 Tax=Eriocheir sinensis TaxID=95602 RepID=UPI0021C57A29|nr:diacylglycerol O-acyltransferase 1-like [Eriocheir sinensis]